MVPFQCLSRLSPSACWSYSRSLLMYIFTFKKMYIYIYIYMYKRIFFNVKKVLHDDILYLAEVVRDLWKKLDLIHLWSCSTYSDPSHVLHVPDQLVGQKRGICWVQTAADVGVYEVTHVLGAEQRETQQGTGGVPDRTRHTGGRGRGTTHNRNMCRIRSFKHTCLN